MGRGQLELAQQAERVGSHVAEVVLARSRSGAWPAGPRSGTGASIDVDRPESRLSKRTTWKPRSASICAEARVPAQQLHAQPHHQQQRRVGRVAEGLVAERDPASHVRKALAAGLGGGHGCSTDMIVIARSPPGVWSVRSSPFDAPARAWPTGESIEIFLADGSASVAGTSVNVISLPALASA